MANSPQRNVSSHVLVVFRRKGVGQHHYYLDHRHQCYLLQTGNDEHSWLPPFPVCRLLLIGLFPRLCVWLLHLSLHVLLLSLSRSFRLSISLSFFFVFFHPVSPLSSRLPPLPISPPPLSLSLTPLSLSPSLTVCIASSLSVYFSLVA